MAHQCSVLFQGSRNALGLDRVRVRCRRRHVPPRRPHLDFFPCEVALSQFQMETEPLTSQHTDAHDTHYAIWGS